MHAQKLLVTMALFAIGAYTLPHGAHNARNFENALDKLENLDQAVDPPKEPGPVEGEHHGAGPGPVKRADADQGYEGAATVKRAEADQGYEGYRLEKRNFENALDKLENLDQAVDPPKEPGPVEGHHGGGPGPAKRADADQGYQGYGTKRADADQAYEGVGAGAGP